MVGKIMGFRLPDGDEWERFKHEEIDTHSGFVSFLFNTQESLILWISKRIVVRYLDNVKCVEVYVSKSRKYIGIKPARKGLSLSRRSASSPSHPLGAQIAFSSIQSKFDLLLPIGKHIEPIYCYDHGGVLVIPLEKYVTKTVSESIDEALNKKEEIIESFKRNTDIIRREFIEVICPYCSSLKVAKRGFNILKSGKKKQKYFCHTCKTSFIVFYDKKSVKPEKILAKRLEDEPRIITLIRYLYSKGISPKEIKKLLEKEDIHIDLDKLSKLVEEYKVEKKENEEKKEKGKSRENLLRDLKDKIKNGHENKQSEKIKEIIQDCDTLEGAELESILWYTKEAYPLKFSEENVTKVLEDLIEKGEAFHPQGISTLYRLSKDRRREKACPPLRV